MINDCLHPPPTCQGFSGGDAYLQGHIDRYARDREADVLCKNCGQPWAIEQEISNRDLQPAPHMPQMTIDGPHCERCMNEMEDAIIDAQLVRETLCAIYGPTEAHEDTDMFVAAYIRLANLR